jgi:hypothetical protein
MIDSELILVTVVDKKFYNFLKALANSVRINSPNVKLVVRIVGFTPSLEEFKTNYYKNTEFIFDNTTFKSSSLGYEYCNSTESKIKYDDDQSCYSKNIIVNTINNYLNDISINMLLPIDVDCIIRKNLSIVNSYLTSSDIGLLPLPYMKKDNQKYYQFGFVPIKNNPLTRSVFFEFERRLNVFQQSNQPLFNEILRGHKDLKIYEFDDSIVSGVMKTWKEEALIWHASGYQKFWDTTFRKEFYKYLSSKL